MSPPRIGFGPRIDFLREFLAPWSRPLENLFLLFSAMPIFPCQGKCPCPLQGGFASWNIIHHIRAPFARLPPRLGETFTSLQRNWLDMLNVKPLTNSIGASACGALATYGWHTGETKRNRLGRQSYIAAP